jgi:hypothetical protein
MRTVARQLIIAAFVLSSARTGQAQTADDIVERYLAAIGGRAALATLKSRTMTGTITLSTPGGNLSGPVEITNQAPNKLRTLIRLDLTALGAGQMVLDQRFDGTSGYALDSVRGNREITGSQLELMKNTHFPTPFLNYREQGIKLELAGKEKVGDREAYVLIVTPRTGPAARQFFDAESYLPVKVVLRIDVPQVGEIEQTVESTDFRDVDGFKVPFTVRTTSVVQTSAVAVAKVQHNASIDETIFSKPGAAK